MEEVFSILFAETNDTQSFENSLEKNFVSLRRTTRFTSCSNVASLHQQ